MASVQIVYGIVKNGAFTANGIKSETVTVGSGAAAPMDGSVNAARVTAIDAACWVGFASGVAADPRIYLAAGASFDFLDGLNGKQFFTKAYP